MDKLSRPIRVENTAKVLWISENLPIWLKLKLMQVRHRKITYEGLGTYIGYHLKTFGIDIDIKLDKVPDNWDAALSAPSASLRSLFANDDPRGKLIDCIPHKRRRQFLHGFLRGYVENE